MAAARRREARVQLLAQAILVWSVGDANVDAMAEFIRCGELPGGQLERIPYNPAVEAKIEEIRANGGKLIVKPE
jgi:hypothetical protein